MNLYEKLALIRKMVSVIQKSKQAYGYKYVTEDEILAKITAGMDKYHVSLIPMIKPNTSKIEPYKYVDKKGKDAYEILFNADMLYKWVNDENPDEYIDVDWFLAGQQADVSMSFGSALSYSNRYFLLKYFQVATVDDDPDNWRSKQKSAEEAAEIEKLKELRKEILDICTKKIELGINKESLYKVIADYADGKKNPNAIKDIKTAEKVLDIITNMEVNNE